MNQFGRLYEFCQTLEPKVSRRDIQNKALEITGIASVKAVKTTLDTQKVRGFFLSAKNTEARIVQQLGCNVIVLARDLNYCWERFVFTKELMHLFDTDDEKTGTEESFDGLLSEFEVLKPGAHSSQLVADVRGLWMALACLCPEKHRLEFIEQLEKGHIDHYGIALRLRIPQMYVPHLLRSDFKEIVESLLK
ncbi:MAG: hypothetical protein K9J74_08130 [Sulfuritalea sp.]|nr:hypothetical protein [Sulfuritalea sp.]